MEQEAWGGFSTSAAQLAARDVAKIRTEHSALFRAFPVQPEAVAKRLDIAVELAPPARGRAQLRISSEPPNFVITVDPSLGPPTRRFAVAHEVGHAVLFESHPEIAREFATHSRERYADHFASNLLVPSVIRPYISEVLRVSEHPREILTIASRFGVSPAAFFRIASGEGNWFRGSETIWLRVKHIPNPATGKQPRLRVVSAHYDWNKYFIPRHISLRSLCGDGWLSMLSPGGEAELSEVEINLSIVNLGQVPKYVRTLSKVRLRGVRLSASDHDRVPYYLVAITVLSDTREKPAPSGNLLAMLERVVPVVEEPPITETQNLISDGVQLALW